MDVADQVEDRHRLALERFISDLTNADPRVKKRLLHSTDSRQRSTGGWEPAVT